MQTRICKVLAQSETTYVTSRKTQSGQIAKSTIRLRELGGDYEDEYQCTLLGSLATCRFSPEQRVIASLHFMTHENNGVFYQDIVATEIVPIK